MAHFNPNATIGTPVVVAGNLVINNRGETVAVVPSLNPNFIHALVDLINKGAMVAQANNDAYERKERMLRTLLDTTETPS